MPVKVTFPEPDNLGIYRFGDGSTITPERDTSRWNAWWPDGSPLRDEDGCILRFDSPGTAAYALVRGGAAMDNLPPPPVGNESMLSLDIGDGDKVDVYLRRQGDDPDDPASFLSSELSFATPHMVGSIHGLKAKPLRQLAEMLVVFADEMESIEDDE